MAFGDTYDFGQDYDFGNYGTDFNNLDFSNLDLGSTYVPDYSNIDTSFYDPTFKWDSLQNYSSPISYENGLNLGTLQYPTSLSYDPYNIGLQPIAEESPDYWGSLTGLLGKTFGDVKGGEWLRFGGGALGTYLSSRANADKLEQERENAELEAQLMREQLAQQAALTREKQRLGASDDFAKMHALAQILQARQGINLDPSLAYAEAVRREMGLSPQGATPYTGIDVGGPMHVAANRQAMIPAQYAANFAQGGQYNDPGYAQGGYYNEGGSPHVGRGALSLIAGHTGGQEDAFNARLSDGEFVLPADVVSALGDGNTNAGGRKLEKAIVNIRKHKTSKSAKSLPPKALSVERYFSVGDSDK